MTYGGLPFRALVGLYRMLAIFTINNGLLFLYLSASLKCVCPRTFYLRHNNMGRLVYITGPLYQFDLTLTPFNYLCMPGLELNHVSKRGPRRATIYCSPDNVIVMEKLLISKPTLNKLDRKVICVAVCEGDVTKTSNSTLSPLGNFNEILCI